jgi:hypothetical protein
MYDGYSSSVRSMMLISPVGKSYKNLMQTYANCKMHCQFLSQLRFSFEGKVKGWWGTEE